ncbi:MAG: phosphatase PAP2 family protein [Planctomycetes bacterium]|nr:phosphatase PAP2 family protein [Planctomycetota bacterium]
MAERAIPLTSRLRAQFGLKLGLTVVLWFGFCIPYFSIQLLRLFPSHEVPITVIDRTIAFNPDWVFAYQSIYLLMPLLPWLCTRRDELFSYALGFFAMCLPGFVCFLFFPVMGPRPEAAPSHAAYAMLVGYDGSGNAWPSLHVGLALYTFLFGWRLIRDELSQFGRAAYVFAAASWTLLIAYSTLATKQHWLVDLPPGLMLACLGDLVARKFAPFGPRSALPVHGEQYAMAPAASVAGRAAFSGNRS